MLTLTLITLFALYLVDKYGKWRVVYNWIGRPILTVIAFCLLMAVSLGALGGLLWLVSEKISDSGAAIFVFTAAIVAATALFWRMYAAFRKNLNSLASADRTRA